MLAIRHILVPLDESNFAEHALNYASLLLPPEGRLSLLTVVDSPIYINDPLHMSGGMATPGMMGGAGPAVGANIEGYQSLQRQLEEDAQTYLQRVATVLQETQPFQVEALLKSGDVASLIIDTARESHVDLIVMTAHGHSGLSRLVFGSIAERILGQAPCPVLVIPETALPKAD